MGFGPLLVQYLVASAFIGGLLTLVILSYRASPLSHMTSQNMFLRNFVHESKGIPYGIALGIGGLMVYPKSPLMMWAIERLSAG
jgi:prepilin peptidase CpaA